VISTSSYNSAFVHIWNRCPTDAVDGATPYELWYGDKPDVSHLRVWECTAYVHVQKDKLAFAAIHDLHLHSVDASNVYLNGEMDCDVYVEQHEWFGEGDPKEWVYWMCSKCCWAA